ncbi:MAG TPA: mycothiol conjugate amidase Mca [Actinocrinis sp.]|uniref:mycothiol conjugate amidase Mca n=1 Tax=Actinocrinis sp. TaxID=1920516 RepID=UPI002DDD2741|nr:mycothiol conjugate amidase Mca [Actinocrinis sp.]HEV2347793.1 mycothiol conjugate amidase Mca [Actinocrinis sp.]
MDQRLRLMAVHAHPDDESSKGAATMARYVAEGVDVLVVTCTGGERGDVLNPKLKDDPELAANIHEVRRAEMAAAREILGVNQAWLGFVDSGLPEGDPLPPLPEGCFALEDVATAAQPLVKLMREFRPHVVTTYDEDGGYPHPDHIQCHNITVAAFDAAPDPDRYPEAGEPWQPLKLYYDRAINKDRVLALHNAMEQRGLESPYAEWIKKWWTENDPNADKGGDGDPDGAGDKAPDGGKAGDTDGAGERKQRRERKTTTRVQCADYFEIRDRALLAHATQIDPDGWWFSIPMEIQREVWPTEDYELIRSHVDTTLPEDDLFAGVHETVAV